MGSEIHTNIFVLTTPNEALTMQFRNIRFKLKQKRRNFEVTEILKRPNFGADAKRSDVNRGIIVLSLARYSTTKIYLNLYSIIRVRLLG